MLEGSNPKSRCGIQNESSNKAGRGRKEGLWRTYLLFISLLNK